MKSFIVSHGNAGGKSPQFEAVEIEAALRFRIAGLQHLKAMIKLKALLNVGLDSPPGARPCF